ncbi:MAG: J domain-containing protein [bacterium]
MDPLFERFQRLLRSYLQFGAPSDKWFEEHDEEADFREAWEELDEFLRSGTSSGHSRRGAGNGSGTRGGARFGFASREQRLPPEELRKDYELFGVAFGASFQEVRSAYRRLMRTHHPDLHAGDNIKQREATHKSQQLNTAYQRIKAWEAAKRGA